MAVTIQAREIAAGDYSLDYGTVEKITEHRDRKTSDLISVDLFFWNGQMQVRVDPNSEFSIIQGGLTDRTPNQSVRPGLGTDRVR